VAEGRKLRVLTGVPGSGKTTAATSIAREFKPDWVLLHADDAIGPTFAVFAPKPWAEIRQFHPLFTGWSAGWNLAQERNVLVEGHLKDEREVEWLLRGVRDLYRGALNTKIVWLDGDPDEIADKLAANPYREPDWRGPSRRSNFKEWITNWAVERSIADAIVDSRGKTPLRVEAEVILALEF